MGSVNPITGSKYNEGYDDDGVYARHKKHGVQEHDCDLSGFVALLEAMKSSAVAKLIISDCDIGPKGLMTSAPLISVIPALTEVNLSVNKLHTEDAWNVGDVVYCVDNGSAGAAYRHSANEDDRVDKSQFPVVPTGALVVAIQQDE